MYWVLAGEKKRSVSSRREGNICFSSTVFLLQPVPEKMRPEIVIGFQNGIPNGWGEKNLVIISKCCGTLSLGVTWYLKTMTMIARVMWPGPHSALLAPRGTAAKLRHYQFNHPETRRYDTISFIGDVRPRWQYQDTSHHSIKTLRITSQQHQENWEVLFNAQCAPEATGVRPDTTLRRRAPCYMVLANGNLWITCTWHPYSLVLIRKPMLDALTYLACTCCPGHNTAMPLKVVKPMRIPNLGCRWIAADCGRCTCCCFSNVCRECIAAEFGRCVCPNGWSVCSLLLKRLPKSVNPGVSIWTSARPGRIPQYPIRVLGFVLWSLFTGSFTCAATIPSQPQWATTSTWYRCRACEHAAHQSSGHAVARRWAPKLV